MPWKWGNSRKICNERRRRKIGRSVNERGFITQGIYEVQFAHVCTKFFLKKCFVLYCDPKKIKIFSDTFK